MAQPTLKRTLTATALQNEPLDALVWRVLGAGPELLGDVMNLNRDLAPLAAALPENTPVILPVITAAPVATREIIQLWS